MVEGSDSGRGVWSLSGVTINQCYRSIFLSTTSSIGPESKENKKKKEKREEKEKRKEKKKKIKEKKERKRKWEV